MWTSYQIAINFLIFIRKIGNPIPNKSSDFRMMLFQTSDLNQVSTVVSAQLFCNRIIIGNTNCIVEVNTPHFFQLIGRIMKRLEKSHKACSLVLCLVQ